MAPRSETKKHSYPEINPSVSLTLADFAIGLSAGLAESRSCTCVVLAIFSDSFADHRHVNGKFQQTDVFH